MIILEDLSPDERRKYLEERKNKKEVKKLNDSVEEVRYRCEQTAVIRANGMIISHADTKREFVVKKRAKDNNVLVEVDMVDNIIETKPEGFAEAVDLLVGIDNVKCSNLIIKVDNKSGEISSILNHEKVLEKWNRHKTLLYEKYNFLRAKVNQEKRDDLISLTESQIKNKEYLTQELKTKLFYDLFFDKYLVSKTGLFEPYSRLFNSQLFEGVKIELDFKQEVLKESPEMIYIKKSSTLNKKKLDQSKIEQIYDSKYKPNLKYKFSEYDFMFIDNCVLSTGENYWIEESNVNMIERVKNNVEVLINYKLKKVE